MQKAKTFPSTAREEGTNELESTLYTLAATHGHVHIAEELLNRVRHIDDHEDHLEILANNLLFPLKREFAHITLSESHADRRTSLCPACGVQHRGLLSSLVFVCRCCGEILRPLINGKIRVARDRERDRLKHVSPTGYRYLMNLRRTIRNRAGHDLSTSEHSATSTAHIASGHSSRINHP